MGLTVKAASSDLLPPRWAELEAMHPVGQLCGAFKGMPEVNRFRARYRLARAFKGASFDGYSPPVARGYDALMRLMLTWSALEMLLPAIGESREKISSVVDWTASTQTLYSMPGAVSYFKFIDTKLKNKQRKKIAPFFEAKSCCGLEMAAAVRHVFAHGLLTPTAQGTDGDHAAAICEHLVEGIFEVVDAEFKNRVQEVVDAHRPPWVR